MQAYPLSEAAARRRAKRRAAQHRIAVVRAAKRHKEAQGLGTILSTAELDAVLPEMKSRNRIGAARAAFFGRTGAVSKAPRGQPVRIMADRSPLA